jgi:hypothetical protein
MSTVKSAAYISQKQGDYFGYPKCCIKSFIGFINGKKKRDPIQNQASHPEGFVPCVKHAKQIIQKKVKVIDLLENRVSMREFQQSNYDGNYMAALEDNERFKIWLNMVGSEYGYKSK